MAGAHPAGPFAAMQYMQYGSGPFAMAFAYPGEGGQGEEGGPGGLLEGASRQAEGAASTLPA